MKNLAPDENKFHKGNGEDWLYGCLHMAWPQNKVHDFCPIVECEGDVAKCQIPRRLIKNMISGKKRAITYAVRKTLVLEAEIDELNALLCSTDVNA